MSILDIEIKRELDGLKKEKYADEIALKSAQYNLSDSLKNGLGDDINDVLSGKKLIKLSFKERLTIFLMKIFNKI